MRILLVGPCHGGGSLPPYLSVLTNAFRRHGVQVDRLGSGGVPYDAEAGAFWPADRILAAARALLDGVELAAYVLISLHFGNLETEQLLPTLWPAVRRPPVVYHVHSLDWTLFTTHVPEPSLHASVEVAVRTADGYVFFGRYARAAFAHRFALETPSAVAWLPTTIPLRTPRHACKPHLTALTDGLSPACTGTPRRGRTREALSPCWPGRSVRAGSCWLARCGTTPNWRELTWYRRWIAPFNTGRASWPSSATTSPRLNAVRSSRPAISASSRTRHSPPFRAAARSPTTSPTVYRVSMPRCVARPASDQRHRGVLFDSRSRSTWAGYCLRRYRRNSTPASS